MPFAISGGSQAVGRGQPDKVQKGRGEASKGILCEKFACALEDFGGFLLFSIVTEFFILIFG